MRKLISTLVVGLSGCAVACSDDEAASNFSSNDASATGGATGTGGGAETGGRTNTGGRTGTGGRASTGGATNTGGSGTGGTSTGGGANTGGANAGGANTGGANTGGANTGGANTGGTDGGTATGGTPSTGGAGTGGAATGGAQSTGGASSSGGTDGGLDGSADACTSESCMPECTTGDRECVSNSVRACAAGKWGTPVPCTNKTCVVDACQGVCTMGTTICSGLGIQTCDATGQWGAPAACPASPVCDYGACTHPSCNTLAATCGSGSNESCCESASVPGGTFYRSYDAVTYTDQTAPATLSTFVLDKFEVTVGRFRKFVSAVRSGWKPPAGSGKHKHLNAGAGITGETGWDSSWTLSSNFNSDLACGGVIEWTNSPGANENDPINCMTWYEIYGFCIWDGGFLPTEAEWNYAAAGGSEQRVYPWSSPATSSFIDTTLAVWGSFSAPLSVGSKPNGTGRWGHMDLAGNIIELTLDTFATPYGTPCTDCASVSGTTRVIRGGFYFSNSASVLNSNRFSGIDPAARAIGRGGRCARSP